MGRSGEAAQTANRLDEGFRKQYQARCYHKPKGVAKVATARKLAVRLYWMLRQNVAYPEIDHIESSLRVPRRRRSFPEAFAPFAMRVPVILMELREILNAPLRKEGTDGNNQAE